MRLRLTINFYRRFGTAIILGSAFWISFVYFPPIVFSGVLGAILLIIIFFEWHRLFTISSPVFWLTLPLYPILPFALLIILNHNPVYRPLLFMLFMIVFSFDTGSYIVGSILGKHPILPRISPYKTWEGVLGGYIFACIGFMLVCWEEHISVSLVCTVSFVAVVTLLSLIGDFFESWLKRRAHIKDSGTFLPGHGGFLDRFDGILFTVFFFYGFRDWLLYLFYT